MPLGAMAPGRRSALTSGLKGRLSSVGWCDAVKKITPTGGGGSGGRHFGRLTLGRRMNASHIEAAIGRRRMPLRISKSVTGRAVRRMEYRPASCRYRSTRVPKAGSARRRFRGTSASWRRIGPVSWSIVLCPAVVRFATVAFRCSEYRGIQSICAVQYRHGSHSVNA